MSLMIQIDPPLSGQENMLRDQHYYSQFDPEQSRPKLRFYTWSEPTLSIGRFQKLEPTLEAQLHQLNIPVVRRPTGGAGILHAGDLTFSLVLPARVMPGSILQTHEWITDTLQKGLNNLGLDCKRSQPAPSAQTAHRQANCFEDLSPADLSVTYAGDLRKLIGTAQVRRRQAILVQGMFYLQTPTLLLQQVFGEDTANVLDLQTLLGYVPDHSTLIDALSQAIKEMISDLI